MITIEECLQCLMEVDDCKKASRQLGPKVRKLKAEDSARLLLSLLDEDEDYEELTFCLLVECEKMPGEYFDDILNSSDKLLNLYNNN